MCETLYERYEKIRDFKGLTDYKVTKLSGIKGTATISNWKNGKYVPKDDKMQEIANALEVPLDYLKGTADTIECEECGYKYDLLNNDSVLNHSHIHELMEKAAKHYGFYYNEDYCRNNISGDLVTLQMDYGDIDLEDKIACFIDYAKCNLCYELRKSGFVIKYDSTEKYIQSQILSNAKESFMNLELYKALCERYEVNEQFSDKNAIFVAKISNNKKLMNALSKYFELSPEYQQKILDEIDFLSNIDKKQGD